MGASIVPGGESFTSGDVISAPLWKSLRSVPSVVAAARRQKAVLPDVIPGRAGPDHELQLIVGRTVEAIHLEEDVGAEVDVVHLVVYESLVLDPGRERHGVAETRIAHVDVVRVGQLEVLAVGDLARRGDRPVVRAVVGVGRGVEEVVVQVPDAPEVRVPHAGGGLGGGGDGVVAVVHVDDGVRDRPRRVDHRDPHVGDELAGGVVVLLDLEVEVAR